MIRSVGPSVVILVDEATKVGEARRRSVELAARLGFDDAGQAAIALVVTEAASNLAKHATGGQLILEGQIREPAGARLDVIAVDCGPGMRDVSRCMADGYSSFGSSGAGLGAIKRIATELEIFTQPGKGTILRASFEWAPPASGLPRGQIEPGVLRVCAPNELVCGDDWAILERDGQSFILMADGLGHGHPASLASAAAVSAFAAQRLAEPADILGEIHRALHGTRGAAVSIARIDAKAGLLRYAGVGNISGVVGDAASGELKSMISLNGTVGHSIRKIQAFDYPWTASSILIMHSDGVSTHWNLENYPGILSSHPAIIAGALYRDFKRGRDDVCVLAGRAAEGVKR